MNQKKVLEYWTVWYPKAAATGLLLARGLIEPVETLLLHSPPNMITVEVSDSQGGRLAYGKDLKRTEDSPFCRLRRKETGITREDGWPTLGDRGSPVLLPGGEVGTLKTWWHASDNKELRWQVEFYNTVR